jgi:YbbR domain-containing protein
MRIRFRTRKPLLRILALATGFIIWFYVLNAARVRVDKTVTIQYVLPPPVVFAIRPPTEMTVTLEGPRAFMRQLEAREEKILVDLTLPQYRDQNRPVITFQGDELTLPFGVRVEKMTPRKLELRLERKAFKKLPVRTPFIGELPDDLHLKELRVRPTEVEVVGPRSVVASLKEISTRPVDVETLYGQDTLALEWQLPDERLAVNSPTAPELSYKLTARKANLVLEKMPVRLLGEAKIIGTKEVTVVLWGPPDIIRRTDKSDLNVQVWAEVPDKLRGEQRVRLRAVLPPRLHLVELRPQTILVEGP